MHDFPLIATIAAGFLAAWVLGLLTHWLKLSPIVGYLLAGVLIGPYTPGFVGDVDLAHQLAEFGVILLMFGVGLHFHLKDLLAVKWVAVPGAIGQSLAATLASIGVFSLLGMNPTASTMVGMAMAVASTVVLMRVLMDAEALNSPAGHIAVGWLLVEDVLTVMVLVMIPALSGGASEKEATSLWSGPALAILTALLKLAALVAIAFLASATVVPWVLTQVAKLRSRELFTLTVMVFSVAVAAGAYALFGASMALGAFLAGMAVAQSPVSHQAAADALPLRDAFAVLFFVAVGMLFDPTYLVTEPVMVLAAMSVILLVKPLVALLIVGVLGHSVRTALTVAIGLAQVGEFSFILSDVARKHSLMPDSAHNLLVAGAILSITLNPLLFRSIGSIENFLRGYPRLWILLNARAERRMRLANSTVGEIVISTPSPAKGFAIVVGYGPVGQTVDRLLRDAGFRTLIIDANMYTVTDLRSQKREAIFGDASREAILESAEIAHATHLVLTLPQSNDRAAIVATARQLNANLKIFVRARYLRERNDLEKVGATAAIFEEAEAAVALARLVLVGWGAGREKIESQIRDIRTRLILSNVSNLRRQRVGGVMAPWTRVRRLALTQSLDEVRRQLRERDFSRWPVVDPATGQPHGYLLAKDLIGLEGVSTDWKSLIRPMESVAPEDNLADTLQRFQSLNATFGVVREHGVPVGIVTLEDMLEQMIGRMEDEYPRNARIVLKDILIIEESLLKLVSDSPEGVIEEIAAKAPQDARVTGAQITELAIARERELPTDLGLGVAIPHARCPGLAAPFVILGRSASGVHFHGSSAEPVHLIFLLATPAEQPDVQVLILSQIAAIVGDPERFQRLRDAASADEIRQVFTSLT